MMKRTVATCVVAVMFTLSAMVLNAQEPSQEMQQLYQEFMMLNQELQSTQQQALEDPEIAKKSDDYSTYVDKKMNEINPNAKALIQQREDIFDNFEVAQLQQDQKTMEQLEEDYQQLNMQLEPIRQQAAQQKDVIEKQQELEADVIKKMGEIDPQTTEKIDRIQILQAQLEKLMPQQ